MSITTYGELKTAIASWATYTDVTSVIPDFITYAHQEIARRLRANVILATSTITVDGEFESQPTGFLAIKRFYLDTSPRQFLTTISPEGVDALIAQSGTDTYPTCVAIEGDQFHFAPLFSGSASGKVLFYKSPTVMSADADTNAVLTKYPFLYLYGALEALYLFKEDDNMSDRYGQRFRALLNDINDAEAKDQMSGPLAMSVTPSTII